MTSLLRHKTARLATIMGLMLVALPALAHVDASHAVSSFGSGFLHPLTGLDHLLAMLAVGIWAAQHRRPFMWGLPLVFPMMMVLGASIGMSPEWNSGFSVEAGIAVSVSVLGLLIAFSVQLPLLASAVLVALFALMHGYAHGVELPATASGMLYAAGFILSTALIQLCGFAGSVWMNKKIATRAIRLTGAGIASIGLVFLVSLA